MNLQEKSGYINEMAYDIRAEYVVSCLLKLGLSQNELLAAFDGPLKRKWSADIDRCEAESFENGAESLGLHLNRAGVYDALPEALFHPFPENRNAGGTELAKDSMKLRAEEKKARMFFRIFENEIFWQGVQVAVNENIELESLYADYLNGLVPGFWKLDKNIPQAYAAKLMKYLPYAHQISGNYRLTEMCFEDILGEKVSMEPGTCELEEISEKKPVTEMKTGLLGRSQLGKNFVSGHKTAGFVFRLTVKIGPLVNTNPKEFYKDGYMNSLVNCFFSYFIPVEVDVETKLVSTGRKKAFVLGSENEGENALMGYNTVL
jgi:hypothetical protein